MPESVLSRKYALPLSVPALGGNEWAYIKECIDTNWVSYVGPFVTRFERDLATVTGADHAVAMTSGTAALHIALLLAGVEPESEVVMPAITFVAPANAVRYCGAWPAFIDLRESDWQIDVDKLAEFLREGCERRGPRLYNRATGRPVMALLPVHLLGGMCDVDAVASLAAEFDLPLVEDAAECLGATYKERPIGAPAPGLEPRRRLVATSFNGNKIVTTGGGGAVLTNDRQLAGRAKHLSTTAKADPIEFFHDEVGFNYRLTNVCAALGVAQLERLSDYVAIKRATAAAYATALAGDPRITVHPDLAPARSTFWLYTVMLDRPARPVVRALNDMGIQSRPVWIPIARLPAFARAYSHRCEFAERFAEQALSLPCSVGISLDDVRSVARELQALLSGEPNV